MVPLVEINVEHEDAARGQPRNQKPDHTHNISYSAFSSTFTSKSSQTFICNSALSYKGTAEGSTQ